MLTCSGDRRQWGTQQVEQNSRRRQEGTGMPPWLLQTGAISDPLSLEWAGPEVSEVGFVPIAGAWQV